MNLHKLFLFSVMYLFFNVNVILAYECIKPGTPSEELKRAAAVFTGKVVAQEYVKKPDPSWKRYGEEILTFKIKVDRLWKGNINNEVVMYSGITKDANGRNGIIFEVFQFRMDESYLIFAYGNEDRLTANTCGRTKKLSEADEDLEELGEGFPPQKSSDEESDIESLIADLQKNTWSGAEIIGDAPLSWDYSFTDLMVKILKIGSPAQGALLTKLDDEVIKDQVIILLGGVGDERAVSPIINAMISKSDIKKVPNAQKINRAANLALTNITVADIIWHHGGGITIEKCPNNPKECWQDWWKKNKATFSVKTITQSRNYSNYPNYGIYSRQ